MPFNDNTNATIKNIFIDQFIILKTFQGDLLSLYDTVTSLLIKHINHQLSLVYHSSSQYILVLLVYARRSRSLRQIAGRLLKQMMR